jgi:hypothetical protein
LARVCSSWVLGQPSPALSQRSMAHPRYSGCIFQPL